MMRVMMRWSMGDRTVGLIAVLAAAASLSLAGCGSKICNCPAEGGHVALPADLPAPVAEVTTSSPCQASQENPTSIFVFRMNGGTCHVMVQLTNGREYEATATFEEGACGCILTGAVSPLTAVAP
jgi:hypothetical protein